MFECIDELKRLSSFFTKWRLHLKHTQIFNSVGFVFRFFQNHVSIKKSTDESIIASFVRIRIMIIDIVWICWCAPKDRCIFVLHINAHKSIRSHNSCYQRMNGKATTNVRSTLGRWLINAMMRVSAILGFNEHVSIYIQHIRWNWHLCSRIFQSLPMELDSFNKCPRSFLIFWYDKFQISYYWDLLFFCHSKASFAYANFQ